MTRSIYLRHKEPYSKDAYGLGLSGKKPTRDSLGANHALSRVTWSICHLSVLCVCLCISFSLPPSPPPALLLLPFLPSLLLSTSLSPHSNLFGTLLSPSWLIPPPCLLFCVTRYLLGSAAAADCMFLWFPPHFPESEANRASSVLQIPQAFFESGAHSQFNPARIQGIGPHVQNLGNLVISFKMEM